MVDGSEDKITGSESVSEPRSGAPPRHIVVHTVVTSVIVTGLFVTLLFRIPDSGATEIDPDTRTVAGMLVFTSVLMLVAGALGATLYNYRGLVKHSQDNDFNPYYSLSYLLRPFQGALSGLMVFFLLLGGALSLNIGGSAGEPTWVSMPGVLPYIAFGILAGYASHEFMIKLKDVAESVFAVRRG